MVTTIPFELAGGGQPLIVFQATVNDTGPFKFILDTGAGSTLITPALASRLGIATLKERTGHGIGGTATVALATANSIAVGSLRKDNVDIGVTESVEQIGRAIGEPLDGGLGHTFFRDLAITIDYNRKRLTFATADEVGTDVTNGTPFQLVHARKPLIQVDVWVNGSGPYPMALDTGASTTVLSPALIGLTENVREIPGGVTGAAGRVPAKAARVRSLRVGDAIDSDADVLLLDALAPLNAALGTELMGIIGYSFLRHYRVTIDYPRGKVLLIPAR
jgi:predicted aspartyl protease